MSRRKHPADVVDETTGQVRILKRRCETCVFHDQGAAMHLREGRFEEIVERNIASGALLTCHSTLPYGGHPDFGPAVCNGFWRRHGHEVAAGRIAIAWMGVVYIEPPPKESA